MRTSKPMTQPSSDKLPSADVCGNHLDRFPCKTCLATVPIECLRFDHDHRKEAARQPEGLADGDMVERRGLAEQIVAQNIEAWGWGPLEEIEGLSEWNLAVDAALAGLTEALQHKKEAERERDELRKWLEATANTAEAPGADPAALMDLVARGARGFLDRMKP